MNKSVLIIDEDPLALKLLTLTLKSAGFLVYTSSNSKQALRQIQSQPADVILLDVNTSRHEGLKVCHELQRHRDAAHLPIVLLSNCQHAEENVNRLASTITHLYKPVSRGALVHELRRQTAVSIPFLNRRQA